MTDMCLVIYMLLVNNTFLVIVILLVGQWAQNFTSRDKDPCLDIWAEDFTPKIEVKMRAFEVKIRAYEVNISVSEVKMRAYEVKISAYD